jgi:hypothetical protein
VARSGVLEGWGRRPRSARALALPVGSCRRRQPARRPRPATAAHPAPRAPSAVRRCGAFWGWLRGQSQSRPASARTGWRSNLLKPSAEATRSSSCGLIPHKDERVLRGPPAAVPAAPGPAGSAHATLNQPQTRSRPRPPTAAHPAPRAPGERPGREPRPPRPGLPAAAAIPGSMRELGAPAVDSSGGSAEPPPHWGQRPPARQRRRGSTRRAATAAVGRFSHRDGAHRAASRRHPQ